MDVEWKHALPGLQGEFLWGGGSFQFIPHSSFPYSITPTNPHKLNISNGNS